MYLLYCLNYVDNFTFGVGVYVITLRVYVCKIVQSKNFVPAMIKPPLYNTVYYGFVVTV